MITSYSSFSHLLAFSHVMMVSDKVPRGSADAIMQLGGKVETYSIFPVSPHRKKILVPVISLRPRVGHCVSFSTPCALRTYQLAHPEEKTVFWRAGWISSEYLFSVSGRMFTDLAFPSKTGLMIRSA